MEKAAVARRDVMADEAEVGAGEGSSDEVIVSLKDTTNGEGSEGDGSRETLGVQDSGNSSYTRGITRGGDSGSAHVDSKSKNDNLYLAAAGIGQTSDNSALDIGSTLSGLELGDGDPFSALEFIASNAKAVGSMKCEALSRTIAAAMINFDEDLRPAWRTLAESLRTVFRKEMIGGDSMVDCPEAELCELISSILVGLRSDEAYRNFGDGPMRRFEQRLQQFMHGLAAV